MYENSISYILFLEDFMKFFMNTFVLSIVCIALIGGCGGSSTTTVDPTPNCDNECNVIGAKQCINDGIATCGNLDNDSCLEWSDSVPCQDGQTCSNGYCSITCSNECTVMNVTRCGDGGVQTCGNHDSDSCLEWGAGVACETGQTCSNGFCAAECSNECLSENDQQCNTAGTAFQTCGDYDDDDCLEWSDEVACQDDQVCSAGNCGSTCQSTCFEDGDKQCNQTKTGFQTCGDYNNDECLEWGTVEPCDLNSTCLDGECQPITTPDEIVINEILFNDDGSDDNAFIELYGEPGVSLLGYTLIGINGNNGQEYQAIELEGNIGQDGFFVIALSGSTSGEIIAAADMLSLSADYQNGPDNVILRWGTTVIDALGYGIFDETETFAGEGNPAANVPSSGYSLGRDLLSTDTDDNASDFSAYQTPTPGIANDQASEDAPQVVFVMPAENLEVTQGQNIAIRVDVTPASGRSISECELLVDGSPSGQIDDLAPYEFNYLVAADAVTDSNISIRVQATDDLGIVGYSIERTLTVRNQPPVASFSAVISGDLEVTVDASGCTDNETASEELQVRWDWTNDGVWDTDYSTDKITTNTYGDYQSYTIAMEVIDAVGQTATFTRTVDFQSIQDVSGTITTTAWYGTINVTGDILVPVGNTLTIDAGTTVSVVKVDQDANGIGDYDISVEGTLIVNGTADNPVIFTTFPGAQGKEPQSWQGIWLDGDGNQLNHAIVEYAQTGISVNGDTTLNNSELRFNTIGLEINSTTCSSIEGLWIHDNFQDGIRLDNAQLTTSGMIVENNGGSGVWDQGGSSNLSILSCQVKNNAKHGFDLLHSILDIELCEVESNGQCGFAIAGQTSGEVQKSQIKHNGYEGVRALPFGQSINPYPWIHHNNILGNGHLGNLVVEQVDLSVSSPSNGYGTYSSSTWSTPDNSNVVAAKISYSESTSSIYLTGYLKKNSGTIATFNSPIGPVWFNLVPHETPSIFAQVYDDTYSPYATMTINQVGLHRCSDQYSSICLDQWQHCQHATELLGSLAGCSKRRVL
jgi:hypothetical protein